MSKNHQTIIRVVVTIVMCVLCVRVLSRRTRQLRTQMAADYVQTTLTELESDVANFVQERSPTPLPTQ